MTSDLREKILEILPPEEVLPDQLDQLVELFDEYSTQAVKEAEAGAQESIARWFEDSGVKGFDGKDIAVLIRVLVTPPRGGKINGTI